MLRLFSPSQSTAFIGEFTPNNLTQPLGYDEIKTEMLEREESIRSEAPERVKQEVWGLVTAYNLVRREMEAAASQR